jgi:putative zinc finger/helix-turn-helix YgiT family protein
MDAIKSFHSQAHVQCPFCDSDKVKTKWAADSFVYGEGEKAVTLKVHIPERKCLNCDSEYTDEQAEIIRHEAVCDHLGILSPREIISIRERLDLTQQEFASITRIGRASLVRWETGALYQNPANDSYLYLLGFRENVEKLKRREKNKETVMGVAFEPKFRAISQDKIILATKEAKTFELFECAP